jgi:Ca2+-binding EF-hand superfamily protein
MSEYGIRLSEAEYELLFKDFDRNNDGHIDFSEFIRYLRGTPNDFRRSLIQLAFNVLDKDGSKTVTLKDLELSYDAKNHPSVINGRKTEREIFMEFISIWDTQKKDGIITFEEFLEYYSDISAAIDDDAYFELMLRNAFHISGGKGAKENTTNLRVLVSFNNGSKDRVIEIENDLGLQRTDKQGILKQLQKQGVADIEDISI